MRWLVIVVLLGALAYGWSRRAPHPAPGVLAPDAPRQEALAEPRPLERAGWRIEAVASFSLRARVLGVERYRYDKGAALAPLDFALGWGAMSDSAVLERLSISQSGRYYFWRADELPIARDEITTSSANMHLIPATPAIERQLLRVRAGETVSLSGYLVNVDRPDGFAWRSSLSRSDTGEGACELVWVEDVSTR